jgi:hypothetical protein
MLLVLGTAGCGSAGCSSVRCGINKQKEANGYDQIFQRHVDAFYAHLAKLY